MKKGLLLLSLIPSVLLAQTIGVEDAQNKALQFLQGQSQTRASQREVQLKLAYTSKSGDETYYYVFNNSAGGYVIMGGDEAAREVLGYGETGSFDYARIPDNMRWWLSQYDAQISQAIREVKAGTNKVVRQSQTRAERAEVPVLLTTKWDEMRPYNMQLPTSQSGEIEYLTGPEPTALAQIMNYHRWPDTGVGSMTLDTLYYGHKFTADFENTHYDWEAMADTYEESYSGTREEIAVGTLMYHLCVATNSIFLDSVITTAFSEDGARALAEHFRYNKGMSLLYRVCYNDTDWETIVYNELSAKRPVFYSGGAGQKYSAAFVCDGYRDGLFHINWGYSGSYDDYYLLTPTDTENALQPGGEGAESLVVNQNIIAGIFPDREGNTQYKKNLAYFPEVLCKSLVTGGDTDSLGINFQNLGLKEETFEIRYKLVNVDDPEDVHWLDNSDSFTIASIGKQINNFSFCVPEGVRQGASYDIIPMYKDENGEWQEPLKPLSYALAQLTIADELVLTKPLTVRSDGCICNDVFYDVSFAIKNLSDNTLTCPLIINIYPYDPWNNPDAVDYFDLGEISLAPNEEREVIVGSKDLHFGIPLEFDKYYYFKLENYVDGSLLSSAGCIIVDSMPISLTVPEMGWTTFAIPYDTEIPEGLKAYSVAYDKDEDSIVLEEQDFLRMNCAYLIHGIPGTYQFIGPDTSVEEFEYANLKSLFTLKEEEGSLTDKNSFVLDQRDGIVGFYRIQEPTPLGKYEAFLVSNSSKDMFVINADSDDPTSLQQIITPGTPVHTRIYDLNGRIINTDLKGLVIRDGKVFIMKK